MIVGIVMIVSAFCWKEDGDGLLCLSNVPGICIVIERVTLA